MIISASGKSAPFKLFQYELCVYLVERSLTIVNASVLVNIRALPSLDRRSMRHLDKSLLRLW